MFLKFIAAVAVAASSAFSSDGLSNPAILGKEYGGDSPQFRQSAPKDDVPGDRKSSDTTLETYSTSILSCGSYCVPGNNECRYPLTCESNGDGKRAKCSGYTCEF